MLRIESETRGPAEIAFSDPAMGGTEVVRALLRRRGGGDRRW
ncbi:hypothetical protein ACWDBW_05275 [Streptomyces sp. NPDC001107]